MEPVDAAAVEAAAQRLAQVVPVTPAAAQRAAVRPRRRRGLAQARGPAGRALLQGPRRLQPHRAAADGRARGRAWCARAPATTPRAWRTPAARSACAAGSTCRAPRRGRSATASRPSAATSSTVVVVGDTYDDAAAAALADAAPTGAVLVPAFDDPRTIAGQGTVVARGRRAARPRARPGRRARRRRRAARRRGRLARRRAHPRRASSGSSRPARRAWRPRSRPGGRSTLDALDALRRRRRGAPGRRRDLPARPRQPAPSWSRSPRAGSAPRCSSSTRPTASSPSPRARWPRRRSATSCDPAPGPTTVVRAVRRQQRRQPVRRGRRAGAGPRGAQALLPRRVPAGARARCARSSTTCSARTTTSRCSSTSSATTARPARRSSASSSAAPEDLGALLERMAAAPPHDRAGPAGQPAVPLPALSLLRERVLSPVRARRAASAGRRR